MYVCLWPKAEHSGVTGSPISLHQVRYVMARAIFNVISFSRQRSHANSLRTSELLPRASQPFYSASAIEDGCLPDPPLFEEQEHSKKIESESIDLYIIQDISQTQSKEQKDEMGNDIGGNNTQQ